jgi:hypothetical protein
VPGAVRPVSRSTSTTYAFRQRATRPRRRRARPYLGSINEANGRNNGYLHRSTGRCERAFRQPGRAGRGREAVSLLATTQPTDLPRTQRPGSGFTPRAYLVRRAKVASGPERNVPGPVSNHTNETDGRQTGPCRLTPAPSVAPGHRTRRGRHSQASERRRPVVAAPVGRLRVAHPIIRHSALGESVTLPE